MDENKITSEAAEERPAVAPETEHEPHKHAQPRILIGVAAVAVVAVLGFVWSQWGATIKEACLGEDGACPVELPPTPEEGSASLFDESGDVFDEGGVVAAQKDIRIEDVDATDLPEIPSPPSEPE